MATIDPNASARFSTAGSLGSIADVWSNIRGQTAATALAVNFSTSTITGTMFNSVLTSGRAGWVYYVTRTYFYWDTSSITGTVTAAHIDIKSNFNPSGAIGAGGYALYKANAYGGDGSAAIINDDFSKFTSTEYSSPSTSWPNMNVAGQIDLNSTARADIQNNDYFICCLMSVYDNDDTDPTGAFAGSVSGYWRQSGTTITKLDYTEVIPGYESNIIGVASGDIGSVVGKASSDIGTVIGV